jgi:hypothetical protein
MGSKMECLGWKWTQIGGRGRLGSVFELPTDNKLGAEVLEKNPYIHYEVGAVLLAQSIVSYYFYGFFLHPDSGWMGGLLFWILGLVLPTICVLFFGFGLAIAAIKKRPFVCFVSGLLISALATYGLVYDRLIHSPSLVVRQSIEQKIQLTSLMGDIKTQFNIKQSGEPFGTDTLRPPKAGGNEGCGCMYWEIGQSDVLGVFGEIASPVLGGISMCGDTCSPEIYNKIVGIDISYERSKATSEILITVSENGVSQSRLMISNISNRYLEGYEGGFGSTATLKAEFDARSKNLFVANIIWARLYRTAFPDPVDKAVRHFFSAAFLEL